MTTMQQSNEKMEEGGAVVPASPRVENKPDVENPPKEEAAAVADEGEEVQKPKKKKKGGGLEKTEYVYIGVMVLAVLAIVLALGLVFGLREDDKVIEVTRAPSTIAPSEAPSASPTTVLDSLVAVLPESSLESLQEFSSPQWKAFEWLANHPYVSMMTEWRKIQLFALTTFYYAYEGPNWNEMIRNNWLTYDVSECFWFSTSFGSFTGEPGTMPTITTPCNENGEFQSLALSSLGLGDGMNPFLPPEIALLTAMKSLRLGHNNVTAHLPKMIELTQQLTTLEALGFPGNKMTGTLPTQLGLFRSLKQLDLQSNFITGFIPSELGMLTAMEVLKLSNNVLSGVVPSQLGLLTAMQTLDLSNNALSGVVQSELGLLTAMQVLDLSNNAFTGLLPGEVLELETTHNLEVFNTDGNNIEG